MTIAREEIFGPVASLMRAKDLDEAIDMIHAPLRQRGLDLHQQRQVGPRVPVRGQCGNIGVNIGIVAPMAFFPFGGMKDSFFGNLHGQGQDVIRFFTESKVVIQRWF